MLLPTLRPIEAITPPVPSYSLEPATIPHSAIPPAILEERQLFLLGVTLGAYGLGILSGRLSQAIKTTVSTQPGPNRAPGSGCISRGGWFKKDLVNGLTAPACEILINHALKWTNPARANPNVVFRNDIHGTPLTTEDGYTMLLTFAVYDSNWERARAWMTQEACVIAYTTMMYDCSGEHDDTIGGGYFYGHDGVAGYQVDVVSIFLNPVKC